MSFQWYYNEAVKASLYWSISGVLLVALIAILMFLKKHPVSTSLLTMYLVLLLGFTVFSRSHWDMSTVVQFNQFSFRELWKNIVIFIPFGFLLTNHLHYVRRKWIKAKYLLGICTISSISIEVIQLLSKRGYFDVADIVGNLFGGMIGFGIYKLFTCLRAVGA